MAIILNTADTEHFYHHGKFYRLCRSRIRHMNWGYKAENTYILALRSKFNLVDYGSSEISQAFLSYLWL